MPLPPIKQKAVKFEYFPTRMQTFIFRNWETVDKSRIAKVLGTSVQNVEQEAARMGLPEQKSIKEWEKRGYITTIRNNWHLVNYKQLTELIGWTEDRLELVLKEEDFLDVKLGGFKPDCEILEYRELTECELTETEKIKNTVKTLVNSVSEEKEAFDFWNKETFQVAKKSPATGQIIVDDDWIIEDKTGNDAVGEMVERFIRNISAVWGVSLDKSKNSSKKIELSLLSDKEEEYHEIYIKENIISVKGGSSAGILRGLYRIEDLAKFNGGMFFDKAEYIRKPRFGARFIYSFCGLYERALDVDSNEYCPDSILEEYARTGVNGIWLQGVLYRMVEFLFEPKLSDGWEKRLENLRSFVKRAEKYGIKIYLYINEPRTMPLSFFEKFPDMKGAVSGQYACMCVSSPKTQKYLYDAIEKICREVPELGGFFTITMSENLTHCKSRMVDIPCETCKNVKPWELVKTVNSIVAKAAQNVNPAVKVFAWNWSWTPGFGMSEEDVERCIKEMPENVIVMAKREKAVPFVRGGIKGEVRDYSISVEGLSESSRKVWRWAKESNHEIAAKMQINCSWECSTTPYIPVYRTLYKHLEVLAGESVDHIMLSWTLGGYPSPSIRMVSETFFIENNNDVINFDKAMHLVYGENAEKLKCATDKFCEAFSEFPFNFWLLYKGPQNGGISNILYHKPTSYNATMTCFSYDDVEGWRSDYPADILENQYRIVSEKWEDGMKLIEEGNELSDIAYVSYSLFRSSFNQTKFVRLRDKYIVEKNSETIKELIELIEEEKEIAKKVYKIMCRHPEVGFEAANHYYYSKGMVMEKIINCNWLIEYYSHC